jgi:hypothetical protein
MPSLDLGFGDGPPHPLPGASFSMLGEIQPPHQASHVEEVVIPLTWNDTGGVENLPPNWTQHWSEAHQHYYYFDNEFGSSTWTRPTIMEETDLIEISYLQFSLSDIIGTFAAEAKLLWPVLRLPSVKPQGLACHMGRLGQGEIGRAVAFLVASFLWYERDPAADVAVHRSVSVDWADSCEIIWISSVGTDPPAALNGLVEGQMYPHSVGIWIKTNKDSFKLVDGSALSHSKTHEVVVAFHKLSDARWFVGVWVDGLLCTPMLWEELRHRFEPFPYPVRLHPGEAERNLERGGRGGSGVVEWIASSDRLMVADLQIHSGELLQLQ